MGELYQSAAEELTDWFVTEPLSIAMETDMQVRLIGWLQTELTDRNQSHGILHPGTTGFNGNKVLTGIETAANYKEPYVKEILKRQRSSGRENSGEGENEGISIPRVRSEVNVTEDGEQNEQLDVAVLKQELRNPVKWNDGSKRYSAEDLEAGFELKFIANQNVISNPWGRAELNELSEEQIRQKDYDNVAAADGDLQSDIKSLRGLPTENVYLIVLSHYNYLMQEPLCENQENRHRKRNEKLAPLVDKWMCKESSRKGAPDIFYAHPGGAVVWRDGKRLEP